VKKLRHKGAKAQWHKGVMAQQWRKL